MRRVTFASTYTDMDNKQQKKTLVIGATENRDRYANRATRSLLQRGHPVELLGLRAGEIDGHPIKTGQPNLADIDTVTMYVGPRNQTGFYEYIRQLKPRRVIFNPGAENPDFARQLRSDGIEPVNACTLVMLSVGNY
jgi:uncharacterized protein